MEFLQPIALKFLLKISGQGIIQIIMETTPQPSSQNPETPPNPLEAPAQEAISRQMDLLRQAQVAFDTALSHNEDGDFARARRLYDKCAELLTPDIVRFLNSSDCPQEIQDERKEYISERDGLKGDFKNKKLEVDQQIIKVEAEIRQLREEIAAMERETKISTPPVLPSQPASLETRKVEVKISAEEIANRVKKILESGKVNELEGPDVKKIEVVKGIVHFESVDNIITLNTKIVINGNAKDAPTSFYISFLKSLVKKGSIACSPFRFEKILDELVKEIKTENDGKEIQKMEIVNGELVVTFFAPENPTEESPKPVKKAQLEAKLLLSKKLKAQRLDLGETLATDADVTGRPRC